MLQPQAMYNENLYAGNSTPRSLVVVISCVLSILFGSRGRQFGVLSTWIFLGLVFPDHPPLVAHMAVLHCTRRGPYMGGIKTNQ